MKITEIIKIEESNTEKIYLFKEGFFWRAYERSAYRFVKYIRNFQVIKKHIKKVNQEICYIGFPENMLEVILSNQIRMGRMRVLEKTKARVSIQINKAETKEEFENWKASIIIPALNDEKWVIQKIKEYPVFAKTPLETVQFVAEIQERLKMNL